MNGIFRKVFFTSPRFCPVVSADFLCATPLWCRCLERRELPAPLLADVTVSPLELPGEARNGRGRVQARLVQPADVVAVFGRVVLHGSNFGAFLVAELQNGEDTSEFTDHPLLEGEKVRPCDDGGTVQLISILT